ncbi:MAG: flagellar export protein FliJ [Sulfurimonas sp.]|jgi:flagellar export protein FliJ|nr:flagellar export protein FliJ [Sulfurimonadaceae bacterium]
MKTKFTPLLSIKKNELKKSELALSRANIDLQKATKKLEDSYKELEELPSVLKGSVSDLLKSRMLLEVAQDVISKNKESINFAKNQVLLAKDKLQKDTQEFEKFSYLEAQEIKKALDEQKKLEAKNLDEVALLKYKGKKL